MKIAPLNTTLFQSWKVIYQNWCRLGTAVIKYSNITEYITFLEKGVKLLPTHDLILAKPDN